MVKRRASFYRTATQRSQMWYNKMDPNIYAVYLLRTKDLAFQVVQEYQVEHEILIKIVRDVLSNFPSESHRQHSYLWYALEIWYNKNRYSGKTLLKHVNAIFTYYYMLGLNEDAMRKIAERLGVLIPDWDIVLEPLAMPVSNIVRKTIDSLLEERKVYDAVYNIFKIPAYISPVIGKIDIDKNVEYVIIETSKIVEEGVLHLVHGFVDASRSTTDLIFREYVKVHPDSGYIKYYESTIRLSELKEAIYIETRPSIFGLKITVQPVSESFVPFTIFYSLYIARVFQS